MYAALRLKITCSDIDAAVVTKTEVDSPASDMMSRSPGSQAFDKHKPSDDNPDSRDISDFYLHSCFQKYWQNHERIRAWLNAMESHCEKRDVRRNWYWQMVSYQMQWVGSYMHWWYGEALGTAASSLVPRYDAELSGPVEAQRDASKLSASRKRSRRASKKRRSARHKHRCSFHRQITEDDRHIMEMGDDNECDNDVFEFEMSEELLQFFKQTAEHRKERGMALHFAGLLSALVSPAAGFHETSNDALIVYAVCGK
jgi:hypothetical protein